MARYSGYSFASIEPDRTLVGTREWQDTGNLSLTLNVTLFSSHLIISRALIRARTSSTTVSGTDPFFLARRTFQSSDFT